MKYYATICSYEKFEEDGEGKGVACVPAIDRYTNPRLKKVLEKAQRDEFPMIILSGEYGFLKPSELIPWYDHLLSEAEVEGIVEKMIEQNEKLGITELHCFMDSRDESGWEAYYQAFEKFGDRSSVKIEFHTLDELNSETKIESSLS